jgi:hypothetical protein
MEDKLFVENNGLQVKEYFFGEKKISLKQYSSLLIFSFLLYILLNSSSSQYTQLQGSISQVSCSWFGCICHL